MGWREGDILGEWWIWIWIWCQGVGQVLRVLNEGYERTQTLKLRFLYVTDSTLNPIVGIVVTTSPICYVLLAFPTSFKVWRGSSYLQSVQ
jgi:hypothetical protein